MLRIVYICASETVEMGQESRVTSARCGGFQQMAVLHCIALPPFRWNADGGRCTVAPAREPRESTHREGGDGARLKLERRHLVLHCVPGLDVEDSNLAVRAAGHCDLRRGACERLAKGQSKVCGWREEDHCGNSDAKAQRRRGRALAAAGSGADERQKILTEPLPLQVHRVAPFRQVLRTKPSQLVGSAR